MVWRARSAAGAFRCATKRAARGWAGWCWPRRCACSTGTQLEATPLHQAVLAAAGPSVDALAGWTYQAPSTRYAALAPLVVDAAAAGDPAGLRLIRRAADEAGQLVRALDPRGELPLCLGGSLAPPILQHMAACIAARVQPSQGDACDGALLLARGLARSDLPA